MDVRLGCGRMDVHVHRSSLGKHLRVKIFLRIFFLIYWWVLGNLCEVSMSNQDPSWTQKNGGRAHTGVHERKRLRSWMAIGG